MPITEIDVDKIGGGKSSFLSSYTRRFQDKEEKRAVFHA